MLDLGQVWLPGILRLRKLLHWCGTSIPIQYSWFVRRVNSSGHICLSLLHVGSDKEAVEIQLQLVFPLGLGLAGHCFQLGLFDWRYLEYGE